MGLLKKLAIYTTSNGFTNDALGNVVTKQTANLKSRPSGKQREVPLRRYQLFLQPYWTADAP